MANRATCLGMLSLSLAITGCTTTPTAEDYDHTVNFSNYSTFAFMRRERPQVEDPVATHIEDTIKADLTRRNYSLVSNPDIADFVVDFTIGAQERTDTQSYSQQYQGNWFRGCPWWGQHYWGDGIDLQDYRQGTLSIDVFDTRSRMPVWHGWSRKELPQHDSSDSDQPVRETVLAVLAWFPPVRLHP
jgi:hypothetical protein